MEYFCTCTITCSAVVEADSEKDAEEYALEDCDRYNADHWECTCEGA